MKVLWIGKLVDHAGRIKFFGIRTFEIRTFEIWTFEIWTFEIRTFEIRKFLFPAKSISKVKSVMN